MVFVILLSKFGTKWCPGSLIYIKLHGDVILELSDITLEAYHFFGNK